MSPQQEASNHRKARETGSSKRDESIERLIYDLKERAKELTCLYEVQEILNRAGLSQDEVFEQVIAALPPGWQYPNMCRARIISSGKTYQTPGYVETPWVQSADILVQDEVSGRISVCYTEERPDYDEGPFLKEERKLINTIAEQLGAYILHQRLRAVFQERQMAGEQRGEWWVILDFLKRTDQRLAAQIARKMANTLVLKQVKEADQILAHLSPFPLADESGVPLAGENQPLPQRAGNPFLALSDEIFAIAGRSLSREEILDNMQKWIKEDRSGFLINAFVRPGASLSEITAALERYHHIAAQGIELAERRETQLRVALIRHILSDQPFFIRAIKPYVDLADFNQFMHRVIYPHGSHGKLGGKGAGLFLAGQILKKTAHTDPLLANVRIPRTWYLTSDSIFYFLSFNNLDDIIEQKYKELDQVKQEYPFIISIFKSSPLPPEIIRGLEHALDDFGEAPLIVRSSSLMEDQRGAAFAGKYRSVFIANQGSKPERLAALMDAVKEVFASMFGPDPIEYRAEHGLVDSHEEMGILIQEVVGVRAGRYYLPAFGGVAFSNNDFRWSSRIRREDGLVRIVPGLGTRAVDRLSDDYSVLAAPGSPNLRVNVTLDEMVHYAPRKLDVINLEARSFESVEIRCLLRERCPAGVKCPEGVTGRQVPLVHELVSVLEQDHIRLPSALGINFEKDELVVTFEGLFTRTPFLKQIQTLLGLLKEAMNYPVDIEFAHDGTYLYLLQCRPQSYRTEHEPAPIPSRLEAGKVIFTANRYVANGSLAGITHIVYVDPQKYGELTDLHDLRAVGGAVSRLNQLLPRRQFILMGPGRWGSRGDIKLGVGVTYSDINNSAMLIEIARKQGGYLPEPSFGTHFFQDLVEASIFYLPLYPDDPGVVFNEGFLKGSPNLLPELLPDFAPLQGVVRVIHVPAAAGGQVLQVWMNAELEKAMAALGNP